MLYPKSLAGARTLATLVVFCFSLASQALAQRPGTTPVFLALPDRFPNLDARVVLVREPDREIVVLDPAAATADELLIGLRLLNRVRRERGAATNGEVIPVLGFYPPDLAPGERRRFEAVLAELRRRPVATVGALGPGRWMRLPRR